MAWIQSQNPAHADGAFKDGELDEIVRFSSNGKAQVTGDIADYLLAEYPDTFSRTDETESDAGADESGESEGDDTDEDEAEELPYDFDTPEEEEPGAGDNA